MIDVFFIKGGFVRFVPKMNDFRFHSLDEGFAIAAHCDKRAQPERSKSQFHGPLIHQPRKPGQCLLGLALVGKRFITPAGRKVFHRIRHGSVGLLQEGPHGRNFGPSFVRQFGSRGRNGLHKQGDQAFAQLGLVLLKSLLAFLEVPIRPYGAFFAKDRLRLSDGADPVSGLD